MTNKELIAVLQKLPQDLPVLVNGDPVVDALVEGFADDYIELEVQELL